MGSRVELDEIKYVNHGCDGGWEIIGRVRSSTENRCYLRNTLFKVGESEYREAHAIQVDDTVWSITQNPLQVSFKKIYPREECNLIMLQTSQAFLELTIDHRIIVPGTPDSTKCAGDLKAGQTVYCGNRPQKLTKVQPSTRPAELVELRFSPDDPVETRLLPQWGILTKGSELPEDLRTDDGYD